LLPQHFIKERNDGWFFEGMRKLPLNRCRNLLKSIFNLNPDFSKLENLFDKDSKRMQTFEDWDDEVLHP
jgi:esterase/lipase superfamily enzyme